MTPQFSPQTVQALRACRRRYMPRERMATVAWTRKYRRLVGGPVPGRFQFERQPAIEGILDAFDDPSVREMWTQKSAQFGYTQGVELNIIGKTLHNDPSAMLVIFPKSDSAKRWMREKLRPAIEATPVLAGLVDLSRRNPDATQDYLKFPGGFIQLVGSNSPDNMKSTDAPVVVVSEPDDTSAAVGGAEKSQGDAITIGRERIKWFPEGKLVVGGTPTIKDFSAIESGMMRTDRRRFFVECPHCGHAQHLQWKQVRWSKQSDVVHPVYGVHEPETARYHCESCDDAWSDRVKNELVKVSAKREDKGWRATAAFSGARGSYLTELASIADGSRLEVLAQKFLEAAYQLKRGNDGPMRSFVNNQLGESWEIKRDIPEVEMLRQRAKDYPEWTCPAGGLVVFGFVDVQRGGKNGEPRLEVALRAYGREQESWLVYFGIVPGNPLELATWDKLDKLLATPIRNLGGGTLGITALAVDAGDGMTSDAVYSYVRRRKHLGVIATKGSSIATQEIFTPHAKLMDANVMDKAQKYGLKLFFIGVNKAKDDIDGRLRLTGDGPRRMHWYLDVPADYLPELTSERRVPSRNGKLVWDLPAGKENEALDCEVGCLYLSMRARIGSYTEADWHRIELQVRQGDLLAKQWIVEQAMPGRAPEPVKPADGGNTFQGFGGRRR